jgi:hypothetical protein
MICRAILAAAAVYSAGLEQASALACHQLCWDRALHLSCFLEVQTEDAYNQLQCRTWVNASANPIRAGRTLTLSSIGSLPSSPLGACPTHGAGMGLSTTDIEVDGSATGTVVAIGGRCEVGGIVDVQILFGQGQSTFFPKSK